MTCLARTAAVCHKLNIIIDYDGTVHKQLTLPHARTVILQLMMLHFICILAYIIRHYSYVPTTVVGDSIYSSLASSVLTKLNIKHVMTGSRHRNTIYHTADGWSIEFDTPPRIPLGSTPVIPLSEKELKQLEEHTGLNNLSASQKLLLSQLGDDNIIDWDDILQPHTHAPHITHVRHFFGKLIYVETTNSAWITENLLSGHTMELMPEDILIQTEMNSQLDTEPIDNLILNEVKLARYRAYRVNKDDVIEPLTPKLNPSFLYSLASPRPFHTGNTVTLHPFHLPSVWDPLFAILVVTTAVVTS